MVDAAVRECSPLAVVLLAYGGPRTIEEVEPFLRRIMRPAEPEPEMVARAVERYEAIGGGSPLIDNTLCQRDALRAYLTGEGKRGLEAVLGAPVAAEVFVGMRHTPPWAGHAVAEACKWAGGRAVAVILASHQSERATGGYRDDVRRALEGASSAGAGPMEGAPAAPHRPPVAEVIFVRPWHTSPGYLDAVADRTRQALAELSDGVGPGSAAHGDGRPPLVLFSAHSLPVSGEQGDPVYERALFDTARGVMARVGDMPWRLAYQSRSGRPGTVWLGPGVEDVLAEEAARGTEQVAVVPLGFVVEHLETLYDLDIALRAEAAGVGLRMARAATVTDHPAFIATLADAVARAVQEAGWRALTEEAHGRS